MLSSLMPLIAVIPDHNSIQVVMAYRRYDTQSGLRNIRTHDHITGNACSMAKNRVICLTSVIVDFNTVRRPARSTSANASASFSSPSRTLPLV